MAGAQGRARTRPNDRAPHVQPDRDVHADIASRSAGLLWAKWSREVGHAVVFAVEGELARPGIRRREREQSLVILEAKESNPL